MIWATSCKRCPAATSSWAQPTQRKARSVLINIEARMVMGTPCPLPPKCWRVPRSIISSKRDKRVRLTALVGVPGRPTSPFYRFSVLTTLISLDMIPARKGSVYAQVYYIHKTITRSTTLEKLKEILLADYISRPGRYLY